MPLTAEPDLRLAEPVMLRTVTSVAASGIGGGQRALGRHVARDRPPTLHAASVGGRRGRPAEAGETEVRRA
ncbi:hypothetical protein GCM10009817_01340 [Terrabacter lapilli]|uniref:Uncharacterized protein n=1 Tax=Terrabacter lapilli TaxID=436231 RepID=A0ABN2R8V2_9MICO